MLKGVMALREREIVLRPEGVEGDRKGVECELAGDAKLK